MAASKAASMVVMSVASMVVWKVAMTVAPLAGLWDRSLAAMTAVQMAVQMAV